MNSFEARLTALENASKKRESVLEARIGALEQTIRNLIQASNELSSTKTASLSWPEMESSLSELSEPNASAAGPSKDSKEGKVSQDDLVSVEMLQDILSNNQEVDFQLEEIKEEMQQIDDAVKGFGERMAQLEEDTEIVTRRVVTKTTSSRQGFGCLHDSIRKMQCRIEKVATAAKKATAHASAVAAHLVRLIPRVDNHDDLIDKIADDTDDVRTSLDELQADVRTLEDRVRRLMQNPQPIVREMGLVVRRMLRERVRRRRTMLNTPMENP